MKYQGGVADTALSGVLSTHVGGGSRFRFADHDVARLAVAKGASAKPGHMRKHADVN